MIQPILLSHAWILLVAGILWYFLRRICQRKLVHPPQPLITNNGKDVKYSEDAYYNINPLSDFDLAATEPIKIRPFKPKYHLTMALENITISDLVAMDNTYASRIALRRSLVETRSEDVLAVNPIIEPSVLEFYTWMTRTYLPTRFPTVFILSSSTSSLVNLVTGENLPLVPASAREALALIGSNVDDDFLFLFPTAEGGKYRLEGFITCFPSGFNTFQKLGMSLRDIHGPVPGYQQKLERSMDRFFAALPVGKIVRRVNWSITTHSRLFCLSGNHTTEEEAEQKVAQEQDWDVDDAVLRCERQTLHRLPGTKALVFGFKTYQYGLKEVRKEGSGEELAQAVEGLGSGSTPGMRIYKSAVVWGERVCAFLRGEIDS